MSKYGGNMLENIIEVIITLIVVISVAVYGFPLLYTVILNATGSFASAAILLIISGLFWIILSAALLKYFIKKMLSGF